MIRRSQIEWAQRLTGTFLILYFLLLPGLLSAGIFRWQEPDGHTHYGDQPPEGAHDLRELHIPTVDGYSRIAAVIDGDTVELGDGRRVRLLGINTPEVAHHGRPGEALGEKAKGFLERQLKNKKVRLRYDIERRDRYDRLLAHIFLEDGRNINAMLLQKGLAHALFKWPNIKHIDNYYTLERRARQQGKGIWALPAYRIRPMENLLSLRNRFVRLRGTVDVVEHKRRYSYLTFRNRLRVAVDQSRLPLFEEAGIELDALPGKKITLRGWLRQRDGSPFLKLEHPYQLERQD
ncbi:MAG: thermonuclease family protein [Pseudomonadota bacterium]